MIGALIISNCCLVLMVKGVPTWLSVVLAIVYSVCNGVALILWEETKNKIRVCENKRKGAVPLIGEKVIYQFNDKNFFGVVKKVTYDEQGRATVWIECIPLGALIPAEYEKLIKSPKRDEKGGAE